MYESAGPYSPRAVEAEIVAYVEAVLADPHAPFNVGLLTGSPGLGIGTLLARGVVPRLAAALEAASGHEAKTPTPPGHLTAPVQLQGSWAERGVVGYCLAEADVPATPPGPQSPTRLLLVACTDVDALPEWVEGEGPVYTRTLPIGPLSLFEAHDFIESRLGGTVDPEAAYTLASLAGFTPLALGVIITECRSNGVLERLGGTWQLLGDPVHDAIVPYVRAQVESVSPAYAKMMFHLAFTEPFSLDALSDEEAAAAEDLERVTEAAFTTGDWQAVVEAADLAEQIDAAAGVDVAATLTDAAPLAEAASLAATRCRLQLLAAAASRQLPDPERAHDHLERAERWFDALSGEDAARLGADLSAKLGKQLGAVRAELLHYLDGDLDAALQQLTLGSASDARAAAAELGGSQCRAFVHLVHGGRHEAARSMLASERRSMRLAVGPLQDETGVAEALLLVAAGTPAEALRQLGQLHRRSGSAHAQSALERSALIESHTHTAHTMAALASEGPVATPLPHRSEPSRLTARPDLTTAYLLRGSRAYAQGQIDLAHRMAKHALKAAKSVDAQGVTAAVLALLAETSALRGDHAAAVAFIDRSVGQPTPAWGIIGGAAEAHRTAAGLLVEATNSGDAPRLAAARFIDQGQFGFASDTLYSGVRFARRRAARDLLSIAEHLDGTVHQLRLAHASALLADDPVALFTVAEQLRKAGLQLHSAEVAATVARISETPESLRNRAMIWLAAFLSEQALPGHALLRAPGSPAGEVRLTPREREISELINTGLSNAEIAGRLSLSLATIEGHITRIYRKTGGRRRAPSRR